MTTYRFRKNRCSFFKRSDGKEIVLLPSPYCKLCALPIPPSFQRYGKCSCCHRKDTRVDRKNLSKVYAASLYITDKNYFLNKEIFNCKSDFSFENGLAEILEHAMMKMYPNLLSFDFMVPVPRGKTGAENHMTHIAEILSKKVGIPTKDILFKKGEYLPQLKLKKDERITNVAGKIGCREQIVGRVILMDDMYTTGATMLNSAIPLREKGATEVVGFVIARAVSTSDLLHAEILEVKEDA